MAKENEKMDGADPKDAVEVSTREKMIQSLQALFNMATAGPRQQQDAAQHHVNVLAQELGLNEVEEGDSKGKQSS